MCSRRPKSAVYTLSICKKHSKTFITHDIIAQSSKTFDQVIRRK